MGKCSTVVSRSQAAFEMLLKALFSGYLIVLTVLLLIKEPQSLVGMSSIPFGGLAHLISFLLLAVLAMAARRPGPPWLVILCLVGYASGTELLQGLISWRGCEWADWLQDVAGILVGVFAWQLGVMSRALPGRGGEGR